MNFISQVKKNPLIYVALVVIILYAYMKLFRSEGAELKKVGAGKEAEEIRRSVLARSKLLKGGAAKGKGKPIVSDAMRKRKTNATRKGKNIVSRPTKRPPTGTEVVGMKNLY